MPIFGRFVRYLTPYVGQIFLAVICAVVISVCTCGYARIIAETVDLLESIKTEDSGGEPVVRYFQIEGFFDGLEGELHREDFVDFGFG